MLEPDPGSIVRTTPGADNVRNQRVYRGRAGLTARSGSALRSHSWLDQGSSEGSDGGTGSGLEAAAQARAVGAQARLNQG